MILTGPPAICVPSLYQERLARGNLSRGAPHSRVCNIHLVHSNIS